MTLTEPVPHLHSVDGRSRIDVCAAEVAVRDLLVALGRDPRGEHLADTPRRVASAYAELLSPETFQLTTFPNDEGYDELVVVRDIPDHVVAYGCPAVPVRPVRAGDEVAAPEELPAAATPRG